MKKSKSSRKYFQLQRKRTRRAEKKRRRFKKYRRHKNRHELHYDAKHRQIHRKSKASKAGMVNVPAPVKFDFVDNTEEVSRFISILSDCFEKKKPVFVDLSAVEQISYDAISVMLSAVVRFKAKKIRFNGNVPHSQTARAELENSGFFDLLYKEKFGDNDRYKLASKGGINTHAMRTVDSTLGEKLIESASELVWGEKRRCTGVQRVLIELMQNTNNHASKAGEKDKHWWVSIKHDSQNSRAIFSFVDYGVGVFESLESKDSTSLFKKAFLFIRNLKNGNNAEILKSIFEGELHKTASGKYYRGKGLPGVFRSFKRNRISNLCMITNNVRYSSMDDSFSILQNSFSGTFFSWELNQNNESKSHTN